jgi:hypothetical protein
MDGHGGTEALEEDRLLGHSALPANRSSIAGRGGLTGVSPPAETSHGAFHAGRRCHAGHL